MNWFDRVDLQQAVDNCTTDIHGDWYRDPWGWPEFNWILAVRPDLIQQNLNATGALRSSAIEVPKDRFGYRPASVLDPVDRITYQCLVDSLSQRLIGSMPPWVYGWRLSRTDPVKGLYVTSSMEWAYFRNHLHGLAVANEHAMVLDIASFFERIDPDLLGERVYSSVGGGASSRRLLSFIRGWQHNTGRSLGLPQRCSASSVLANMYLADLDNQLGSSGGRGIVENQFSIGEPTAATRWMDDLWIFAPDEGFLRTQQVEIHRSARDLGLDLNSGKTELLDQSSAIDRVRSFEHSAVDDSVKHGRLLDENLFPAFVQRIADLGEYASRTDIHFAMTRIRRSGRYDLMDMLWPLIHRMPHGADHFARGVRDSGAWRGAVDWYIDYKSGDWSTFDWAVAQFGTMFPANLDGIERLDVLTEGWAEDVIALKELPLLALASSRLASWEPGFALETIRVAGEGCDDPLKRRVLALAALDAGENSIRISSFLGEYRENYPLLELLRAREFARFQLTADY